MKISVLSMALLGAFLLAPGLHAQEGGTRKEEKPASLPRAFDLRKVEGVTPVKQQKGGTCWSHGTIAAIESNLLVSGTWKKLGGKNIPCLSEYHLDWWNGFNQHKNDDLQDPKSLTGLRVHQGGDYRVSAAYISRGDGVVTAPMSPDGTVDRGWFEKTPDRQHPEYKNFYVRDIEWFVIGDNLENIDTLKQRIIAEGALGTAYAVNKGLVSKDYVHYQPAKHPSKPNHAVAIVGWDDDKVSADPDKMLPKPGCWLIKNSWGLKKGDQGYYWISYYDKVCCRDPEMGAVSFRNVEPMKYSHVYFHDYHGWRDTLKPISKAFNVFTATMKHDLVGVSFYTAADNVRYTAKIYRRFEKGELQEVRATKSGSFKSTGFHTVDLDMPVAVEKGESFVVYLEVSDGGQAIDRTSEIPVLLEQPDPKQPEKKQPDAKQPDPKQPDVKQPEKKLPPKGPRGANGGPIVISKANPGESYYFHEGAWRDLQDYRFANPDWATFDRTANFCMKALAR